MLGGKDANGNLAAVSRSPLPREGTPDVVRPSGGVPGSLTTATTVDDAIYAKAMSHPLRARIMAQLAERAASPVELGRKLQAPLGVVAYHVRRLYHVGLLELVEERAVRGSIEHHYRARRVTVGSDDGWTTSAAAGQDAIRRGLQELSDSVRSAVESGGFDHAQTGLARTRLRVDHQGWEQVTCACSRLAKTLEQIERSAAVRIAADPAAHIIDAETVSILCEATRPALADRHRATAATSATPNHVFFP